MRSKKTGAEKFFFSFPPPPYSTIIPRFPKNRKVSVRPGTLGALFTKRALYFKSSSFLSPPFPSLSTHLNNPEGRGEITTTATMFCGDCGKRAGSAECCQATTTAMMASTAIPTPTPTPSLAPPHTQTAKVVRPAPRPVVPLAPPPPVHSPQVVASIPHTVPVVQPPSYLRTQEDEPDSDVEEEAADPHPPGTTVATEWGVGVVVDRFEGGGLGLQGWNVRLHGHGVRLMDAEDMVSFTPRDRPRKRAREEVVVPQVPPPPPPAVKVVAAVPKKVVVVGGGGANVVVQKPSRLHPQKVARGEFTATVTKWMDDKGYGFVSPEDGGADIYVPKRVIDGKSLIVGMCFVLNLNERFLGAYF